MSTNIRKGYKYMTDEKITEEMTRRYYEEEIQAYMELSKASREKAIEEMGEYDFEGVRSQMEAGVNPRGSALEIWTWS